MKSVRLLSALLLGGTLGSTSHAITITEDFSPESPGASPYIRGWSAVGDTNLFVWNSAEGHLNVTWDSSKPNSFFHHPLGMVVSKTNDFSVAFDFKLLSIGQHPGKDFAFQLAVGFIRLQQATNSAYYRGSGSDSPNLVEFTYFPDTGFGASATPLLISTNHHYALPSYHLFEFVNNEQYRIEMSYTGANQTLATVIRNNGTNVYEDSFSVLTANTNFTDVAVDTVSISSYNDENGWGSSILATAIIDNVVVNTPAPPVSRVVFARNGSANEARVFCQPGYTYTLQRTTDFQAWTDVDSVLAVGAQVVLQDSGDSGSIAYYRVKQEP